MVATFDQDLIEQLRVKEKSLTALYYTRVYIARWKSVISEEVCNMGSYRMRQSKSYYTSNSTQCDLDSCQLEWYNSVYRTIIVCDKWISVWIWALIARGR